MNAIISLLCRSIVTTSFPKSHSIPPFFPLYISLSAIVLVGFSLMYSSLCSHIISRIASNITSKYTIWFGQGNRLHGVYHHDQDKYRSFISGIVCNAYFADILHILLAIIRHVITHSRLCIFIIFYHLSYYN